MDKPSFNPRRLRREKPVKKTDEEINRMRDELSRIQRFGNIEIGDIDKLLQTAESQMPYYDSERLYLYELEKQQKIWALFLTVSIFMISLSALLTFE